MVVAADAMYRKRTFGHGIREAAIPKNVHSPIFQSSSMSLHRPFPGFCSAFALSLTLALALIKSKV